MSDGVATLISTAISTVIASVVAWLVTWGSNRAGERRSISDQVLKVIEFAIAYPFLEDDAVCSQWPNPNLEQPNKLRYDNYCCLVFNLLENVWEFCKGNRQNMRKLLHVDELIWRHRVWWQSESENQKGYQIGFRDFVTASIRKREEEAKRESKSNSH